MDLRTLLDLCQEGHGVNWQRLPGGGPAERLVVGLVDVASSDESPALATLEHDYRAVYSPDPTLAVAWGMPGRDWRNAKDDWKPDWLPEDWNGVSERYAHIMLNGAVIWQVRFAAVDAGAGVSGVLPWPATKFADGWEPAQVSQVVGWRTTTWEAGFARLLNTLQDNDLFESSTAEVAAGMLVVRGHPLDAP